MNSETKLDLAASMDVMRRLGQDAGPLLARAERLARLAHRASNLVSGAAFIGGLALIAVAFVAPRAGGTFTTVFLAVTIAGVAVLLGIQAVAQRASRKVGRYIREEYGYRDAFVTAAGVHLRAPIRIEDTRPWMTDTRALLLAE